MERCIYVRDDWTKDGLRRGGVEGMGKLEEGLGVVVGGGWKEW